MDSTGAAGIRYQQEGDGNGELATRQYGSRWTLVYPRCWFGGVITEDSRPGRDCHKPVLNWANVSS